LAQFIHAGNRWQAGGMFILRDDAAKLGSAHYRNAWAGLGRELGG
jgi:hypothetical protein